MHLDILVLPYKFKLILSQNDKPVCYRILDGLRHVVWVTLIVAEYINLFTFTVLKWKRTSQCANETCWMYLVRGGLPCWIYRPHVVEVEYYQITVFVF